MYKNVTRYNGEHMLHPATQLQNVQRTEASDFYRDCLTALHKPTPESSTGLPPTSHVLSPCYLVTISQPSMPTLERDNRKLLE
jgi:hypothetical protein